MDVTHVMISAAPFEVVHLVLSNIQWKEADGAKLEHRLLGWSVNYSEANTDAVFLSLWPKSQKRCDVRMDQVTIMNRTCCCNSIRLFEIANVGARMVGQCESHTVPADSSDLKSSLSCSLWTACKGKASVIQWGKISLCVVKFQRILSLWLRRMK